MEEFRDGRDVEDEKVHEESPRQRNQEPRIFEKAERFFFGAHLQGNQPFEDHQTIPRAGRFCEFGVSEAKQN